MTRPIIIDTDPGQDDAVAILLALASPEFEVLGITAVAGNVPLESTARNARMICEVAGRSDVSVYAGADRPLQRPLVTAEHVHGSTGIDGAGLSDPVTELAEGRAADFIIETVRNRPGEVTLATLGPLTNVAEALLADRELAPMIDQIVMMGGGFFEGGNITPAAEFNVYVDPEAADVVFRSGIPLTVLPLDVTHQALVLPETIAAFRSMGTPVGEATAGMLDFFDRYDMEKYQSAGAPLHDPCVIAYLLRPEMFSWREINVMVETSGEFTTGMTVADWWGVTGREANCRWVRGIDAPAFFGLLVERIGGL